MADADYKWVDLGDCRWLVWDDGIATMRCCREESVKERCEAFFTPFNF